MKPLTAEQRRAENIAFMNKPCKFEQYINPDGEVGKEYHLQNGAIVKINNAAFVPVFEKAEKEFEAKCKAFHDKLFSMGIRAYRCNDGWVNRKDCKVTFFPDEEDYGFYWGNRNLQKGDLIFIGNVSDGGRFATVVERINICDFSVTYTYAPTDKTIDGEYGAYKTKNNLTRKDKIKMFLGEKIRLCTDIYNEER